MSSWLCDWLQDKTGYESLVWLLRLSLFRGAFSQMLNAVQHPRQISIWATPARAYTSSLFYYKNAHFVIFSNFKSIKKSS